MVREIMRDVMFLSQKSEPAVFEDRQIGQDLLDTLQAHSEECVGMAANMIGVRKNIIAVNMGFVNVVMFNPRIISRRNSFKTQEGCLSLVGVRSCTRYREIEIEFQDINFKKQKMKLQGWTAQICQHECDHLEGIII